MCRRSHFVKLAVRNLGWYSDLLLILSNSTKISTNRECCLREENESYDSGVGNFDDNHMIEHTLVIENTSDGDSGRQFAALEAAVQMLQFTAVQILQLCSCGRMRNTRQTAWKPVWLSCTLPPPPQSCSAKHVFQCWAMCTHLVGLAKRLISRVSKCTFDVVLKVVPLEAKPFFQFLA